MSKNVFAITILILAMLMTPSIAQKRNDKLREVPRLNVKANLIVLDENNNFVKNIKKEDIKVFEDNVEQKINYFVQKPPAVSLGFVMDNSGSLRLNLEEIIKGASAIVETLKQNDEAFAVRFVSRDKVEIIQEWTNDKRKLNKALENMYVEGGKSAVIDGLYLSAEKILERYKKNPAGRYVLVLVSDGEERSSYYKYEQLISLLKNTDIQVFMVSFAYQVENNFRRNAKDTALGFSNQIALDTGGTSYILSKKTKKAHIMKFFKTIAIEMRSPYIFGYTPTNQKRDGLQRKLRIEIAKSADGKNRRAFVRSRFGVPKVKIK